MTHLHSCFRLGGVFTVAALLVACGGGGSGGGSSNEEGEDPADDRASTAQGAYGGTFSGSSSSAFQLLLLDDGSFWAVYGNVANDTLLVDGFIQGTGTETGSTFTSTDTRDFSLEPTVPALLSANYVVDTSISGTLTKTAGNATFSGTPVAVADYDYDSPAALSNIAGAWNLTGLDRAPVSLSISSSGRITGPSSGCGFSGTVTPRTSGKNVFDLSLVFGPAPCAEPGATVRGIALTSTPAAGLQQLIITGTNETRTSGTAAFGTR